MKKENVACVICDDNTYSQILVVDNKIIYMGQRKFLTPDHPFYHKKASFNGQQDVGKASKPLEGIKILKKVKGITPNLEKPSLCMIQNK